MLRSKLFDGLKRISGPFRTRNDQPDGPRRGRGFRRPRLECLERRELLSLAGWVASATGPDDVAAVDLATDLEGNVYVTGDFQGTVDFAPGVTIPGDPDILTSSASIDSFAAKYRPDGSLDWVRDLGAIDWGVGLGGGIAVEAVGDETVPDNVYIVARDGDQWKLNGDNGVTIRFDEDDSSLELSDVAVDPATGDIYYTGSFSGGITTNDTVTGERITVISNGWDDVFVAKENSDGLIYWVQHDGGKNSSSGGDSITVDDSGNVYVTGYLKQSGPEKTRGSSDIFVWKLDPTDGSFVWTERAGGDGNNALSYGGDAGYEIAVDNLGGVYVTGALAGSDRPADFGDFQIDLPGDIFAYGFVTKLDDATGQFLWATRFGGDQSNAWHVGGSLDFDSAGNLYLAGQASGAGTYGAFELAVQVGPGWSKGFLATVNTVSGEFEALPGEFEPVQRVGTTGDRGADMLAFDPNDNLFMAGWLNGVDQEFLTGDVLSSTLDANGDPTWDMVLVKLFADDPTNTAPTADAGGPYAGAEDTAITFDASLSGDIDGDPLSYRWDFGDGTTAITTSPTIDHTYEWGDTFAVSVTVSDGRGGTASAGSSAAVAEVNDVPIADADGAYSGVENEIVTFDASASSDFDNLDGTTDNDQTLEYTWDFGDLTAPETTTNSTVDHTYAAAGSYDVTLTVSDGVVSSAANMTTATITTPPVGSANDIYVWEIQFDSRLRGKGGSKHDERLVVTVLRDSDADGVAEAGDAVLAGALATVTVTGPDSSLPATLSGTTDSLGVFISTWLMNLDDGIYTATVDSISLDGFVWNASVGTNVATHTIPHPEGASAAASVDALDQLMAGLGGTTSSGAAGDDSEGLFGSLQDDVAIDLLFS